MRKTIISLALSLGLLGCSLSQFIAHDAVDYNATIEYVNNQQLVLNVLRARDFAPLYFTELGQIHGIISAQISTQLTSPLGPGKLAGRKFTDLGTISVASQPTFDTSPLDTQQFSQGLLNEPSPQTFKYFSDVSSYLPLSLFLFVSKIKIQDVRKVGGTEEANKFCGVQPGEYRNDPSDPAAFEEFVSVMKTLYRCGLSVESYEIDLTQTPPVEVTVPGSTQQVVFPYQGGAKTGPNGQMQQAMDFLTSETKVAGMGGSGGVNSSGTAGGASSTSTMAKQASPTSLQYTQRPATHGKTLSFRYVKTIDGVAVCTSALSNTAYFKYTDPADTSLAQVCGYGWSREETSAGGGASEETFRLRSAGEMFAYLGALQRYQENQIRSGRKPFAFADKPCDPVKQKACDPEIDSQVLFFLHPDSVSPDDRELASDRIEVSYEGQTYYVRQGVANDHTLETLSLLSLMLDLNKNAGEISTTRSVDVNLP